MEKLNKVIGWIGTGVMGQSMCGHLLKAGYTINVFTRTQAKAQGLLDSGARWMTPQDIAKNSDIVILMLGFPRDVEEMTIGKEGIVQYMKKGSVLIDHTTSKPSLAKTIFEECKKLGVHSIDAPVSGGDVGAREARLTIMCGAESQPFEEVKPLLSVYGKIVNLNGQPGMGQHTKATNQIILAGNMIGTVEGLIYASKMGLDLTQTIQTLSIGAASSTAMTVLGSRMVAGNFDPGFYVEHYIKDMEIALEECSRADLCLPNLGLVKSFYTALKAQGGGKYGTQALIKVLEQMNNHYIHGKPEQK